MNDDPTKKLSDAEETALRALGGDIPPSPELEGRVVAALKQRGDIRAHGGWIMKSTKAVAAAVVAGIVFVAGFAIGNRGQAQNVETPETQVATTKAEPANQYMLLMYMRATPPKTDTPAKTDAPRKDITAIIAEYRDWAMAREQEGRLVSAEKLSGETRVMTEHSGNVDIATSSGSDRILGGYFLITAPSLDEALELAKSHPHLKYGGEVEVRPIESTR